MMRHHAALLVCLLLGLAARGDGGTVRFAGDSGPYRVTVFAAPNPFRVGPVDVSLLVQDAKTQTVLDNVTARLRMQPVGGGIDIDEPATRYAATNKLYLSAKFELSTPGSYDCTAHIDGPLGPAQAQFGLEAADKLPPWGELWTWFAWPLVPIGLFALLVFGQRRRERKTGESEAPQAEHLDG